MMNLIQSTRQFIAARIRFYLGRVTLLRPGLRVKPFITFTVKVRTGVANRVIKDQSKSHRTNLEFYVQI